MGTGDLEGPRCVISLNAALVTEVVAATGAVDMDCVVTVVTWGAGGDLLVPGDVVPLPLDTCVF